MRHYVFQIPPSHLLSVIYAILYPLIWRISRLMRLVMSGGVAVLVKMGDEHVSDGTMGGYVVTSQAFFLRA